MNLIVPMAGRGSRLASQGVPKPLVEIAGKPMIAWVLEHLQGFPPGPRVFVVLREHERAHRIGDVIRSCAGSDATVVVIDEVTQGQLCTVLEGRRELDPDDELLVAPCDTIVVSDLAGDLAARPADVAGYISVAPLAGDRWSFARTDAAGNVVQVAEKSRISDHASTGLYHFSSTEAFLRIADEMVSSGERTAGEFYVIPVYQRYVDRGWTVRLSPADEVWDLGTPAAIAAFEARGAHR